MSAVLESTLRPKNVVMSSPSASIKPSAQSASSLNSLCSMIDCFVEIQRSFGSDASRKSVSKYMYKRIKPFGRKMLQIADCGLDPLELEVDLIDAEDKRCDNKIPFCPYPYTYTRIIHSLVALLFLSTSA